MKKIICLLFAALILMMAASFSSCAQKMTDIRENLFEIESLQKYCSQTYRVKQISGTTRTEKFVFDSEAEMNSKKVWGGRVSFVNLELDETCTVEIDCFGEDIEEFSISPQNKDFKAKEQDGVITLEINPFDKVWVEINSNKQHPLLLFANPPKEEVPESAIYFPAGVHNIGQAYKVESDTILYLDYGAYLIGSLDMTSADNVKVMGYGILSGEYKSGAEVMAETQNSALWSEFVKYFMIRGNPTGENIELHGICIINSPCYNSQDINEFQNVKVISPWMYCSDGFHARPTKTRKGVVNNCFAFCGDDIFYMNYSWQGNLEITNCFGASTNNNVFLMGYWGWDMNHSYQGIAKNIYVKPMMNKDVIGNAVFRAVIDGATSETGFKNQHYEDIYIEGNLVVPLISISNTLYPWPEQHHNNKLGNLYDCTFKNITVSGRQYAYSLLWGLDENNGISNVTFENLTFQGVKVTEANKSDYFEINEFAKNITFR